MRIWETTAAMGLIISICGLVADAANGGSVEVGDPMPRLIVSEWVKGDPELKARWGDGNVYLLDLWGTWCAPCVELMPKLSTLHERYRQRGFAVVGYSWEEPERVKRFLSARRKTARYLFANDPEERTLQELSNLEAVEGFPYAFLIDGRGIVRWKGHGKGAEAAVDAHFRNRAANADDRPRDRDAPVRAGLPGVHRAWPSLRWFGPAQLPRLQSVGDVQVIRVL